jgi:hypothetical protein
MERRTLKVVRRFVLVIMAMGVLGLVGHFAKAQGPGSEPPAANVDDNSAEQPAPGRHPALVPREPDNKFRRGNRPRRGSL